MRATRRRGQKEDAEEGDDDEGEQEDAKGTMRDEKAEDEQDE